MQVLDQILLVVVVVMADNKSRNESDLVDLLIKSTDDEEFITGLMTYATEKENLSFPDKNDAVRKEACRALKKKLAESRNEKLIYESLKLLLKFSREKNLVKSDAFDPDFLNVLQRISNEEFKDFPVNLFATKCLSNIIYQTEGAKGMCDDRSYLKKRIDLTFKKNLTFEEKTFYLKFLYLITCYNKHTSARSYLMEECNCRRLLLNRFQDCLPSAGNENEVPHENCEMINEVLKVLFNAMMDFRFTKIQNQQMIEEVADLLKLCRQVFYIKIEDSLLQEQIYCSAGNAVYAVATDRLNLNPFLPVKDEVADEKRDVESFRDTKPLQALLDLLRKHVENGSSSLQTVLPLVALFSDLSKLNSGVRRYFKKLLLPPRRNFEKRPEEGTGMTHKLIKLLTHVNHSIKIGVAEFLFVLCKEDADKFVRYTGYGNAAGLLAYRGLMAGGKVEGVYSESDTDSETEEYKNVADAIDPVTGHIPKPRADPMADMSEEQKEYLAVQLANEISKLSSDSPIQPMCVGEDGKLISMREKLHQAHLTYNDEQNSSEED